MRRIGKAAKTQRPKTQKPINAPKVVGVGRHIATGKKINVKQLTRELAEAREREAATAEVLKVISSTAGNLEPVFNAMLANATRICEAKFGNLFLYEGGDFRSVAVRGDSSTRIGTGRTRSPASAVNRVPRSGAF